jgi:GDP-L-fucose synthase
MPTNLYGPNDNFDLETSHVLPALLRKFHEARKLNQETVALWGTGEPYREFLYVDDLADACLFLMKRYGYPEIGEFINIGTGQDIRIKDLAKLIQKITGFEGTINHDTSKPDGTPRKLLDVSRMFSLGWKPKIELEDGIRRTYDFFRGAER